MTLTFEETRLVVSSHDLDLFVFLWCLLICSYIKGGFYFKRLGILQHMCKLMGKIWSLHGLHIIDFETSGIAGLKILGDFKEKGYFIDAFFQKVALLIVFHE